MSYLTLEGYQISEQLHAGRKSSVYRGIREKDGQAVVLKVLNEEFPPPDILRQFEFEFRVLRELQIPGVVRALSLERLEHTRVIVMADDGAVSLAGYLLPDESLPLELFWGIASQLADIAGAIHAAGIIHKDLNPTNIIITPTTGIVKAIDFGIAALAQRETQEAVAPDRLEGTLAYLSPEQTGRMNRSIDYRSDFYALGATFYRMLTGRPPFESREPVELVHCHIAKQPPIPSGLNPDVPPALSAVVMKLLAKNAEDRYQSAAGLTFDLEQCRTHPAGFTPGSRDRSERFQIPEKLYGREQEISDLLTAFERTSAGGKHMVFCSGLPGIGKSALIHELYKPLTGRQAYFISGKFDALQKSIPYSALRQAFQQLVKYILMESAEQMDAWKQRILEAVQQNGRVLTNVLPDLELIVGAQPEIQALPPTEAQNRFVMVFQDFLTRLATEQHPLVLFLDDLQWADLASLELLQHLYAASGLRYFLLLGAYRSNEVEAGHPLTSMRKKLREKGPAALDMTVGPLASRHIARMLGDTMGCDAHAANELAELVKEKTGGNPFFVREFLVTLHGRKLFRSTDRGWDWDLSEIRSAGITDNVVELLAGKLSGLPEETREILKTAGAIGTHAESGFLTEVCDASPERLDELLRPALNEGIVLKLGETFQFAHDRIHEAAYSLLTSEEQAGLHHRIGKMLLALPDAREKQLFTLVNHLNRGRQFLTAAERDELLDLNASAGLQAKASAAYETACGYFQEGAQALATDCWKADYERTVSLYSEWAEASYAATHYQQARDLEETVLRHATRLLDKVRMFSLRVDHHSEQGQYTEALNTVRLALKLLGTEVPEEVAQEDINAEIVQVTEKLTDRAIRELVDLPESRDPIQAATLDIMMKSIPPAYMSAPSLLVLMLAKMVNASLSHGNAEASPYAYAMFSTILSAVLNDIEKGYQLGRAALTLVNACGSKFLQGRVAYLFGAISVHYKLPLKESYTYLLRSSELCRESGDWQYYGYAHTLYGYYSLFTGMPLLTIRHEIFERYAPVVYKIQHQQNTTAYNTWRQTLANLSGDTENVLLLHGAFYHEAEMVPELLSAQDFNGLCHYHLAKVYLCAIFHDYRAGVEIASKGEAYLPGLFAQYAPQAFLFYQALVISSAILASEEPQDEWREQLSGLQKSLEHLATHCPANYAHKYQLVCAEIGGIDKHPMPEIIALYERAIAGAREQGFLQEEALANECAARYFLAHDIPRIAALYLQEARYCYLTWGCTPKVAQLDERYADLLSPVSRSYTETVLAGAESDSTDSGFVDMATVIKASRAISGEIALERLLVRIMEIIIENAGAQHGCLILDHDGELLVDASANVETAGVDVSTAVPLTKSPLASDAIVRYVFRSGAAVILRDAARVGDFTHDRHIQRAQAKSVLCLPVRAQDRIVGVLYLENDLAAGVFTEKRIKLLNILLPQMAISLENARLYENISASLREKEVLLKEVHHRVKNNLQVISSLLNLQARKIQDEEARNAFQESRNRLRSMTLIHEQLYRSDDLAFLNFADYARSLTAEIMRGGRLGATPIPLRLEIGEVRLALDLAIPCGLIITELISNARKHAFPEGKEGEILLEVQQDAEAGLRIVVADSGVGLPPEFELKKTSSLGLQLVNTLVTHQLKGSISVESQGGARFTVVVPGTRSAG